MWGGPVDPLLNGTALIFHFKNTILTEESLFSKPNRAPAF
jgi:hypothetical protein